MRGQAACLTEHAVILATHDDRLDLRPTQVDAAEARHQEG
jgi:hypothetical protein